MASNSKNIAGKITLLAIMVYFSSYITRINFGAIISAFISAENASKTDAALVTTVAFITYGLGQIISGVLGDKFDPRILILSGSVITASMNIVMSFVAPNIFFMCIAWGFNGFAQAFMWPPLVKILMACLSPEDYDKSVVKIAYGSSGGTIAVYLFSPFIIENFGYRNVFRVSAFFCLIFTSVFALFANKITANADFSGKAVKQNNISETEKTPKIIFAILPLILLTIVIQGMLRDGISTWFPNYISEVFNVPNTKSILTAVVLPVFHLGCSLLTYRILKALRNNVFAALSSFFVLIALFVVCLKLCGENFIAISVIMFALINGFAHSINVLQTEYMPRFFKATGKVSTYAGILNAATYVGSAVSTYAFASISVNYGWGTTLNSWVIFALSGGLLAVICMLAISKKRSRKV